MDGSLVAHGNRRSTCVPLKRVAPVSAGSPLEYLQTASRFPTASDLPSPIASSVLLKRCIRIGSRACEDGQRDLAWNMTRMATAESKPSENPHSRNGIARHATVLPGFTRAPQSGTIWQEFALRVPGEAQHGKFAAEMAGTAYIDRRGIAPRRFFVDLNRGLGVKVPVSVQKIGFQVPANEWQPELDRGEWPPVKPEKSIASGQKCHFQPNEGIQ